MSSCCSAKRLTIFELFREDLVLDCIEYAVAGIIIIERHVKTTIGELIIKVTNTAMKLIIQLAAFTDWRKQPCMAFREIWVNADDTRDRETVLRSR